MLNILVYDQFINVNLNLKLLQLKCYCGNIRMYVDGTTKI